MDSLTVEDFLPTYPDYTPDKDGIFSLYGDTDSYEIIQNKKEFKELRLSPEEYIVQGQGVYLQRHQKFIKRFLSGYTPYDSILLWHDVGTGKTGSSIAVAEGMKFFNQSFQKSLLIARSNTFIRNFKDELTEKMTAGEYKPPPREIPYTDMELTRKKNKLIYAYYDMETFQVFGKRMSQLSEEKIAQEYSNRVIIIDEVHNLRSKKAGGGVDTYDSIFRFLHAVKNCKIILLSATPIKDSIQEFASIMNLILPMDKQLPTGASFASTYFDKNKQLINQDDLYQKIKGRISYLRQTKSRLEVREAGENVLNISHKVVFLKLSPEQQAIYREAWRLDTGAEEIKVVEEGEDEDDELDNLVDEDVIQSEEKKESSGLYYQSRQASLFAVEKDGQKLYGKSIKKKTIKDNINKWFPPSNPQLALDNLKKYSAKYHYIVNLLREHPNEKVFIYCEYVSGSGSNLLISILNQFNYQPALGHNEERRTKTLRYGEIQGKTNETTVENILSVFNSIENKHGEHIQVIIGSSVIGEGRSLTGVRHLVILTPHWNFTDIDQAIGRGIRFGSHSMLDDDEKNITIHRLAINDGSPDASTSIDIHMYQRSQEKDYYIKKIEELARNTAVDCFLFKSRNQYPSSMDNSRECLYTTCNYKCSVESNKEDITDTYNLLYADTEYSNILSLLRQQFLSSPKFSYTLDELMQNPELSKYKQITLMRSLFNIIYRYEQFYNPLGFTSYLKHKDNEFFLSHDMLSHSDTSYIYDTRLGQRFPSDKQTFSDYISSYQATHLTEIMKKIKSYLEKEKNEVATRMFKAISISIRQAIVKQTLERIYYEKKEVRDIDSFILDSSETLYQVNSDTEIIFVPTNERLDVLTGKWTMNKTIPDIILDFYKYLTQIKEQQGINYYGINTEDGSYLISTIDNITNLSKKGQKCNSYTKDELHQILLNLVGPSRMDISNQRYTPVDGEPILVNTKPKCCDAIYPELKRLHLLISQNLQDYIKKCFDSKIFTTIDDSAKCLSYVESIVSEQKIPVNTVTIDKSNLVQIIGSKVNALQAPSKASKSKASSSSSSSTSDFSLLLSDSDDEDLPVVQQPKRRGRPKKSDSSKKK